MSLSDDPIRSLLEDYQLVCPGTIVHSSKGPTARNKIVAASLSEEVGINSVDYVLKRYLKKGPAQSEQEPTKHERERQIYLSSYYKSKDYLLRMFNKLETNSRPEPQLGQFGAALVIERLPITLFSAHLLYDLGHRFEGHAISRYALEQIAWAFSIRDMNDVDSIKKVNSTKSISELKKLSPDVGRMYGMLSDKVHANYDDHWDFIRIWNERNLILYSDYRFDEFSHIIMTLADLGGAVYEITQHNYIDEVESIKSVLSDVKLDDQRPFLVEIQKTMQHYARLSSDYDAGNQSV